MKFTVETVADIERIPERFRDARLFARRALTKRGTVAVEIVEYNAGGVGKSGHSVGLTIDEQVWHGAFINVWWSDAVTGRVRFSNGSVSHLSDHRVLRTREHVSLAIGGCDASSIALKAEIVITRADKSTVDAVITSVHSGGLYGVVERKAPPVESSAPSLGKRSLVGAVLALRDRVVAQTGAQTLDRSLRVCVPASVLGVDDQPDAAYLVSWSYHFKGGERHVGGPGQIRTVNLGAESTIKLIDFLLASTPEDFTAYQAAYGQHFHQCGRCGSPLSDETSKRRGLGPDCFAK